MKTEYSKIILMVIAWVLLLVIVYAMIMMAFVGDLSPLDWILGGLFSLADVAVAFYYWKARKENEIKLRLIYGKDNTAGIIGDGEDEESDEDCVG